MSTAALITNRINKASTDNIFIIKEFLSLDRRDNIDHIFADLCTKGLIKRITNGIYYKPKIIKGLGIIPPDQDKVIKAISKKTGDKICYSGAYAANILGLSTQVPMKITYLTTGRTRIIKACGWNIKLKHTNIIPSNNTSDLALLIIYALISFGRDNITLGDIQVCKRYLKNKDKNSLQDMFTRVPYWLIKYLKQIIE